jgi:hypothetical protein
MTDVSKVYIAVRFALSGIHSSILLHYGGYFIAAERIVGSLGITM